MLRKFKSHKKHQQEKETYLELELLHSTSPHFANSKD